MSQHSDQMAVHSGQTTASGRFRFRITGMTCAGCAAGLQHRLNNDHRVDSATVSITTEIATVDSEQAGEADLIQLIEEHGFSAGRIGTEDAEPDAEQPPSAEQIWKRRAFLGMGLWLPLEALHWAALANQWHPEQLPWLMLTGSAVILLVTGPGFLKSAWQAARRGTSNMDTLISLGALTAFLTSTGSLLLDLGWPLYFTEAAGLLGIVSTGHWIEARAGKQAGSASAELLRLQPQQCELKQQDGSFVFQPAALIRPGQQLRVRPGTRIAVDGTVLEGSSDVDESIVTGESKLSGKSPGTRVIAGSLNTTGSLLIEAATSGSRTTVHELAELVEQAQSRPAPVQRLADRVAAVFVPAVLLIAAITAGAWTIAGQTQTGVICAVTVLIISCPCALGLATPVAVSVGIAAASRRGMLVRSAEALERLGQATRIIFDKTGTLTAGRPLLEKLTVEPQFRSDEVLQLAASVEQNSEHPVASAIVTEALDRKLELTPVTDFAAQPGFGVSGVVAGKSIKIFQHPQAGAAIEIDGVPAAVFTFSDRLRPDAVAAVRQLHNLRLIAEMLSGDHKDSAVAIANLVGIPEQHVFAEMLPRQKVEHLREAGPLTIMVGDGLNDAAAIAESRLGITMTSATDAARAASAVVITGDRVSSIADLIRLSRSSLRVIRQNLLFAVIYNAAAIPAAALGLLGEHGPLWAAAAMGLSDLTVIGNSLRLQRLLRQTDLHAVE